MRDGRVIDNPVSGERIVIRQTGKETNGQLLSFDLFLPPGGHVPAAHAHPAQEELFTVVEGQLRFRVGRRTVLVAAGQSLLRFPLKVEGGLLYLEAPIEKLAALETLDADESRRGPGHDPCLAQRPRSGLRDA